MNSNVNRRKFKRLKIDRAVKVPVHIFPKMPFIGQAMDSTLSNISAGGMLLRINENLDASPVRSGTKIKIHFRLPGKSLQHCTGVVTHSVKGMGTTHLVGIRFLKLPSIIMQELNQMSIDNDTCDRRIQIENNPWCIPTCTFYGLCRKPIRPNTHSTKSQDKLEITLESNEQ